MIREIKTDDLPELREMMAIEGFPEEDTSFYENATWVMDSDGPKGFYSLRMESGLPYMVHFCIKRGWRCHESARKLIRAFKNTVTSFGFNKAIIGIPRDNTYLKRLASCYFNAEPYSANEEDEFYLVEV